MPSSLWDYFEFLDNKPKPQRERLQLTAPPAVVPVQPVFDPFAMVQPGSRTVLDPLHPTDDAAVKYGQERPVLSRDWMSVINQNPVEASDPRIALTPPASPVINAPLTTEDRIRLSQSRLDNLNDPNNPVVNNDKGWKGRLLDIAREAVIGAGQAYNQNLQAGLRPGDALTASLGGATVGGLYGGFNPKADEQRLRLSQIAQEQKNLAGLNNQADTELKRAKEREAIENLKRDDARREQEFRKTQDWKNRETERKEKDRTSREKTARMTQVAGILKNLPAYDPADPKFAELTKALGDVDLPVTPKDAKKKVELKQDQRTGAWEAILTDTSGNIETRPVMQKDGTQLKTTPTVVMQGEYGLLKQDDQQKWQSSENEKNRQQAMTIANERIRIANENLKLAQQRLEQAKQQNDANAQRQAEKDLESMKLRKKQLKAYILNNPLISDNADLLEGLEDEP